MTGVLSAEWQRSFTGLEGRLCWSDRGSHRNQSREGIWALAHSDKWLAVTLHCLLGSKYKGSETGKRLRKLQEGMLQETRMLEHFPENDLVINTSLFQGFPKLFGQQNPLDVKYLL